METSVPSPSHNVPQIIGLLIALLAMTSIFIILFIYIIRQGGPSKLLRSYRERKEAAKNAQDIEMADAAANADLIAKNEQVDTAARQEALEQLNGLYEANKLVGATLPSRPQQVNFDKERDEELRAKGREEDRARRVLRSEQLRATALKHDEERRRTREEFMGRDGHRTRSEETLVNKSKDSLDLAVDPVSYTWGNGRSMAGMYC